VKKFRLSIFAVLLSVFALVLPVEGITEADLTISLGTVSEITALANDAVTVSAVVQNIGAGPASGTTVPNVDIALYLVTDQSQPDELLYYESHEIPGAGNNITVTLSFTAPDGPGTYYLYAVVDKNDTVSETNEQNNYSSLITLDVIEQPDISGPIADLRVTRTNVNGDPVIVLGDRIHLMVVVENTGDYSTKTTTDDFSGLFNVALYCYYLDADTGQMQLVDQSQRPSEWYGWVDGRIDLYFDYALDFEDPSGLATKFKEPNEPLSEYVRDQFSPETILLLNSYDTELIPSLELQRTLEWELNSIIGSGFLLYEEGVFCQVDLPVTLFDLIYRDPPLQGENLVQLNRILLEFGYPGELRSYLHGPLGAGATFDNAGRTFPTPEKTGTYYYVAVADKGDLVLESNESNNWGEMLKVEVLERQPDLKITSTEISNQQNSTVNVMTVVENIGGADTGTVTASLYLFTDLLSEPTQSGQVVAEQVLAGTLVAGETQLVNFSFEVADPTQTYYLAVYVQTDDGGSGITESDESNNWGETLTLQPPDIGIVSTTIMESVSDNVAQIIVRVQNTSQTDITDPFDVELYQLSDPADTPTGVPFAVASVAALAGRTSKTLILTFLLEDTTGSNYIVAVADPDNDIPESSDTNNQGEAIALGLVNEGIEVSKFSVKADKDRDNPWDSFNIAGTIDATLDELSDSISVTLSTPEEIIYTETIDVSENLISSDQSPTSDSETVGGFGINWNNFSGLVGAGGTINGRITSKADSSGINFKYKGLTPSGISLLLLKLPESWGKQTGTFRISARKIDLSGLTHPVTVEVGIGDFTSQALIGEDLINGRKPLPLLLLSGITDSLYVDRAVVNRAGDSLTVKGDIAAQTPDIDLNTKDVTFTWATQSFTISTGKLTRRGRADSRKYSCRKVSIPQGGTATAVIDFDKGTFKIYIKNSTTLIDQPTAGTQFGLSYEGFSASVEIN